MYRRSAIFIKRGMAAMLLIAVLLSLAACSGAKGEKTISAEAASTDSGFDSVGQMDAVLVAREYADQILGQTREKSFLISQGYSLVNGEDGIQIYFVFRQNRCVGSLTIGKDATGTMHHTFASGEDTIITERMQKQEAFFLIVLDESTFVCTGTDCFLWHGIDVPVDVDSLYTLYAEKREKIVMQQVDL